MVVWNSHVAKNFIIFLGVVMQHVRFIELFEGSGVILTVSTPNLICTMNKLKVLILDDEERLTEELSEFLKEAGIEVFVANTAREGFCILKKKPIDLIVLDIRLRGENGLEILREVKGKYPHIEVIVMSAHGDMDTVIEAMKSGAFDYLRKPFRPTELLVSIRRTHKFLIQHKKLKEWEEGNSLIPRSLEQSIERNFIGVSPQIRGILDMAMKVAEFPDTNVLITGESGTGKENIARIIHFAGRRSDHVFCAVNSSAITDSLQDSEFFGHKKGSFTGALADKKGFFEASDKGTLFLDEIADMPPGLQAKMLRAIEEKKVTRVGETLPVETDFRIISATNHDLGKLVEEKKFRLDLIHRLNTIHIHIPPLREHPEDIEPLLRSFLKVFAGKLDKPVPDIDRSVIEMLKNYPFPGNVRELKNMAERAIILSRQLVLGIQDFPVNTGPVSGGERNGYRLNLEEKEEELVRQALQENNFNQVLAAKALGIQRMALARKIRKYAINFKQMD